MNDFERGLRQARARQRRFYIIAICAFALIGVVLASALVSTNGTAIKILPEEAEETGAVSVADGYATAIGNVVYGISALTRIVVRAKGFREELRTIQPDERGRTIVVALTELPGRLLVSTSPALPETRWELDGKLLAIGGNLERELDAGTYVLRINSPYHEIVEREVEIKRATTREISVDLTPVTGQLTVSSNVPNALVSIGGELVGRTPLTHRLEGGEHTVVIEEENYVALKERIAVTNGKSIIERHYNLRLVSATLSFAVEPIGGQLLLDGRRIDPSHSHEVSATSKHVVTYVRDGYHPATETVVLKPREERELSFRLKPELGDVEIHAGPSVDIIIDGGKAGEGSVSVSLTAVPHDVELRKAGYRTLRKTITPSSKRRTLIRENLVPELEARKAESPREYGNSAGIELKLFEPSSFVMGAPRHQKGQRANEFERKVVLKKAFYASKHEITNGQFQLFRKEHSGKANQPVTSVSWVDAAAFCNWLSAKENLKPFYRIDDGRLIGVDAQADGYRLLTEAEWEWLARVAGKQEQTIFPWGDDSVVPRLAGNIADESANGFTSFYVPKYNDGYAEAAPVGSFPAEASGLFDLTGNVSEWVHDVYPLVPPDANTIDIDPLGPMVGDVHVAKGASWRSGTRTLLRAAYRDGLADRRDDVGFRIGRYLYAAEPAKAN